MAEISVLALTKKKSSFSLLHSQQSAGREEKYNLNLMALGFEKWNVYFRIYFVVMAKNTQSGWKCETFRGWELWFKHEKMSRFLIAKSFAWNSTSGRLKFFAAMTGHFNWENMSWQKKIGSKF